MKTVLIATDFSAASFNASKYGVELASVLGAQIVLFYAYKIPLIVPGSLMEIDSKEFKNAAEDRLLKEVLSLRKSDFQPIEIIAYEGDPAASIVSYSKKYKDCLIVCGMKGSSNLLKQVFGTTAISMIKWSKVPVLVIPEFSTYSTISNIALAYDGTFSAEDAITKWVIEIGEKSHAQFFIVTILKKVLNEVSELSYYSEKLNQDLKSLHPIYEFPRSSNIEKGLDQFIKEFKIDLLCINPHHHSLLERLFIKSETQQMIFHTHTPLLILPEVNTV